jgi:hypothetical protein
MVSQKRSHHQGAMKIRAAHQDGSDYCQPLQPSGGIWAPETGLPIPPRIRSSPAQLRPEGFLWDTQIRLPRSPFHPSPHRSWASTHRHHVTEPMGWKWANEIRLPAPNPISAQLPQGEARGLLWDSQIRLPRSLANLHRHRTLMGWKWAIEIRLPAPNPITAQLPQGEARGLLWDTQIRLPRSLTDRHRHRILMVQMGWKWANETRLPAPNPISAQLSSHCGGLLWDTQIRLPRSLAGRPSPPQPWVSGHHHQTVSKGLS